MGEFIPTNRHWQRYLLQGEHLLKHVLEHSRFPSSHPNYGTFRASDAITWLVESGGFKKRKHAVRMGLAFEEARAIALHYCPDGADGSFADDDCIFRFVVLDMDHLRRRIGMVRIWEDAEDDFDPATSEKDFPFTPVQSDLKKNTEPSSNAKIMDVTEPTAIKFNNYTNKQNGPEKGASIEEAIVAYQFIENEDDDGSPGPEALANILQLRSKLRKAAYSFNLTNGLYGNIERRNWESPKQSTDDDDMYD